ncbi:MAG: putative tRNA sulfurtransferase [Firmicutes bacterium ADurb.Bin300]|jgi:thiamine biosynthesis protein ThiI|nr:MAG: putative tRNA sulfurtransferase [Firmicutes bacterium ADurb.Bin300]HOD02239.1 tRNA uracil 4-sulfurtransferase ThiI [Clostridiales bacterium]
MKEVILIKNGELALKGNNRSSFEDILVKNIRRRLDKLGEFTYCKAQSTIIIEPRDERVDLDEAEKVISKVFGIAAYSRAAALSKDMETILTETPKYLAERLNACSSFKVEAKRSDKKFPLTSPEIAAALGEKISSVFGHLSVDVHNPELTVTVEIRDNYALSRGDQLKGAGGLPTGTAGKAALLISGGIDSPVAGYMMAKRGVELVCVHFSSPPYTSLRAEQKVHSLLMKISEFCGNIKLYVVPFTEIQEQIQKNCPEDYYTLIMRRFMMRISQQIARDTGCLALITGESLGQVASQTIQAISGIDAVSEMTVFRPLIGMDKGEIITISRKIETFDISVLPFEDCCTVFTPKHPRTRPKLPDIEKSESALDAASLCETALKSTRLLHIGPKMRIGEKP